MHLARVATACRLPSGIWPLAVLVGVLAFVMVAG